MTQELLTQQSELSLPAPEAAVLGYLATNSATMASPPPVEHLTVAAPEIAVQANIAPEQSVPTADKQTFTGRFLHMAEGLGRVGLLPEAVGLGLMIYHFSHRESASPKHATAHAA